MVREKGYPYLDLSHFSWTPEKEAVHTGRIFADVSAEQKRLADLHFDWEDSYVRLTRQLAIKKAEIADRLGISSVQLEKEMADDRERFLAVSALAHEKNISYPAAEIELDKMVADGLVFGDKVSKYLNRKGSKYEKPMPHPKGMENSRGVYKKNPLEKPKTRTRKPSWKEKLIARAKTREQNKKIEDAVNNSDLDRRWA